MNDTIIGLDAITMIIRGKCPKKIEQRVEKRNKEGKLYLEVDKTKQKDTYNITIILPSIIRPSNLNSFSILDSVKLEYVIDLVKHDLQKILGTNDLEQLIVKKVEVNANKQVPLKVDADSITELMARALLKLDTQQMEYCHGVKITERSTVKKKVLDGFKTARDSSGRFQCKFYRKDRQLGIEGKITPTIRMEIIYNAKGVSQALGVKRNVRLTEILKQSSMKNLIQRYVLDVKSTIMPPIRLYLDDATNLVLEDLKSGCGAYKAFLKRYEIIKYDFRMFRVAMMKFYKLVGNTKQSAHVQCSRIKTQAMKDGMEINEGTVKQLEEFFKEIRLQEI